MPADAGRHAHPRRQRPTFKFNLYPSRPRKQARGIFMQPIFISFYTPAYADEAAGLIASLDQFGLRHDVQPITSAGNWISNCAVKPFFIRDMLRKYSGSPVVWVDADARIIRPPI